MEADAGGGNAAAAAAAVDAEAGGNGGEPEIGGNNNNNNNEANNNNNNNADWDERLSWEDSERFEEDSLCSWVSEPESLTQNWRGWSTNRAENGAGTSGYQGQNGHVSHHRHLQHHLNASSSNRGCSSPSAEHRHLSNGSVYAQLNYTGGLLSESRHAAQAEPSQDRNRESSKIMSLLELSAREVAHSLPFELVEGFRPPVPDTLQLRVAFWSFPDNEDDIRLYSCLANGNADEFQKGVHLYRSKLVKDLLQIGFHLSGSVCANVPACSSGNNASSSVSRRENASQNNSANAAPPTCYNVAVTLDRRHITSCKCTCRPPMTASWCAHIVAVCLHRIHQPNNMCLRAPLSESLSRLQRDQLQKILQYLISEFPTETLPVTQRLLDDSLSSVAPINTVSGAPDPTAGASVQEFSSWCLDEQILHENIRKILTKFCIPSPTVFSDVNYLSSSAPPAATEWQALLRPLRGREPEGLWNLLSIVKELYRRHDSNAVKLLRIITSECLNCDQVVLWWYHTKLSQSLNGPQLLPGCALLLTSATSSNNNGGKSSNSGNGGGALGGQTHSAQYSCASLLDEIVVLWRLLVLNPSISPEERQAFCHELRYYHTKSIEKIYRILGGCVQAPTIITAGGPLASPAVVLAVPNQFYQASNYHHQSNHQHGSHQHHGHQHHGQSGHHNLVVPGNGKLTCDTARFDALTFPGFAPAMTACRIDWFDDPIDGVTYESSRGRSPSYGSSCGYTLTKENASSAGSLSSPISPNGGAASAQVLREKQMRTFPAMKTQQSKPGVIQEETDGQQSPKSTKPKTSEGARKANSVPQEFDEIERLYLPQAQLNDDQDDAAATDDRPKALVQQMRKTPMEWAEEVFNSIPKKPEDELDILISRCEALYAHGYPREAIARAAHLARRMMLNPPDLMMETPIAIAPLTVQNLIVSADTAPKTASANSNQNANSGKAPCNGSGAARRKKRSPLSATGSHEPFFIHPRAMEISQLASATLGRAMFLMSVLAEDESYRSLAFQVGLWVLELPRQPAATKFLEVKMSHQELEIVNMLKQLPLGQDEMEMLRQRAHRFRSGQIYHHLLASASPATGGVASSGVSCQKPSPVLPLSLISYIFDQLSWHPVSATGTNAQSSPHGSQLVPVASNPYRAAGDEQLAFEAAVAALAMKANVSEADHPLLCEGTRRQRGELALALFLRYRDHPEKLAVIMDRLLDHEMHQMYKHHASNSYYYNHYLRNVSAAGTSTSGPHFATIPGSTVPSTHSQSTMLPTIAGPAASATSPSTSGIVTSPGSSVLYPLSNQRHPSVQQPLEPVEPELVGARSLTSSLQQPAGQSQGVMQQRFPAETVGLQRSFSDVISGASSTAGLEELDSDSMQNNLAEISQLSEALDDVSIMAGEEEDEYDLEDDNTSGQGDDDSSPLWISAGGAAAANAEPAIVAATSKNAGKRARASLSDEAGSSVFDDSSSSGISTHGAERERAVSQPQNNDRGNVLNVSLGNLAAAHVSQPTSVGPFEPAADSGPTPSAGAQSGPRSVDPLNKACYVKLNRNRRYISPTVPNQASEAHAHFMMELAKRLLTEAGGNHSTAIFTAQGNGPQASQGHGGGPHRQLHLCAFQIGLYALGVHNKVTQNWLSRTYSSHVSWISGQAMEIGRTAIRILIDTWENHLTPPEVATLADKASQSRDPGMVQVAGELALSALPHAQALIPTEIYRALAQCKEQATAMLEKACTAVEHAAKDYGVPPEVLFHVAQTWYQMYLDSLAGGAGASTTTNDSQQQALIGHFGEAPPPAAPPQASMPPPMPNVAAANLHGMHTENNGYAPDNGAANAYNQYYYNPPTRHHSMPPTPIRPGVPLQMMVRHQQPGTPMPPPPPPFLPSPDMYPQPPPNMHQKPYQPMGGHMPPMAYGVHNSNMAPFMQMNRPPMPPAARMPPPVGLQQQQQQMHAVMQMQQNQYHPVQPFRMHQPPPGAVVVNNQPTPPQLQILQQSPYVPPPNVGTPFYQPNAVIINPHQYAVQLANAKGPHSAYPVATSMAPPTSLPPGLAHQQQQQGQMHRHMFHQQQQQQAQQYHASHLNQQQQPPPPPPQQQILSDRHMDQNGGGQSRYLFAAYRVGMLALETLSRRINDDLSFTKYSQNPTYGDDVKWLLGISKRLGLVYVQQFCLIAAKSVPSPFVLWELASEMAIYFGRSTSGGMMGGSQAIPSTLSLETQSVGMFGGPHQQSGALATNIQHSPLYKALLHPHVQPLVKRCLQMFYAAAQLKLSFQRFVPTDTEEVCSLVKAARIAFLHTPGGPVHFQDFLQSLRQRKACKKDVWNKIQNSLKMD